MSIPLAPKHLQPATRAWWREVVKTWALEEHHRRLLTLLCESWDRLLSIRARIEKDGEFYENRLGSLVAHPGLAAERQERVVFARLLRELDLDVGPPPPETRLTRLRRYK